ncbi:putative heat shock protein [Trypoxylus dichotomus]
MASAANSIGWSEVNELKDDKNVLLVDVREPKELQETGIIPCAINIPLGTLENAFKDLTPEEFQAKYQREKPKTDTPLVFSCRSGNRSAKALNIAVGLGYTNTKNYVGGWNDWAKHL